jgi:uncharacterized protein (TIRG00374 family)
MKDRVKYYIVSSILAGMALYAVGMLATGWREIAASISAFSLAQWDVVLGLSLLNYAMRYARWHWYLRKLGHAVPALAGLASYVAGFAFTTTPGKVGEAGRSIYLRRYGVQYTDTFAALFAERYMDLLVMVVLAVPIAFTFAESWWLILGSVVLAGAFFTAVHDVRLAAFLKRKAQSSATPLRWLAGHSTFFQTASGRLLRSRYLAGGFGIGLVAWTAEAVGFYLILGYQAAGVLLPAAVGIYAISMLAGAVSFLPGGLGSTEAAMAGLLVLVGVDPAVAVGSTIVCRIATLWFAVALGLCALIVLELTGTRARPACNG